MNRNRIVSGVALFVAAAMTLGLGGAAQAAIIANYSLAGTANDSGPNGYHGVGDPTVSFVNDPSRGMVASFDGTGGIDVSASGYSVTESPNFQFAISFWIKPTFVDSDSDSIADTNVLMGATNGGVIEIVGDVGSWGGMGGSSYYGGVGVNSGGGAGSTGKVAGTDLYDGDWHHVVIQWVDPDGTVAGNTGAPAEVYIDDTLATSTTGNYNGNGNLAPTMVLGGPVVWSNGGSANKYYNGLMSDVYFFDGQLTAADVHNLFIPEPATLALLAAGGLMVLRRRRNRA